MSPSASNSRNAYGMAEMLRDGATLAEVGEVFGLSKTAIRGRLNTGGWNSGTGQPHGTPEPEVKPPQASFLFIDQPWATDALCAQTDPELWFPDKGAANRQAKAVCAACFIQAECLDWALTTNERFGIWGGLSERERRKLTRNIPCPLDSCDRVFDTAQGVASHCGSVHKGFTPTPRKAIAS